MRPSRILTLALLLVVASGVAPAMADRIDGNWCAGDGRTLTIEGPRIVTPGGADISGDYDRHAFAYTVPASEPGAGGKVLMVLVNEDTVRIAFGAATEEVWHRCDVVS